MFKNLIWLFLKKIGVFSSYLYAYSISKKVEISKDVYLTGWISNEFKFIGKYTIIQFPVNLIGGKHITIGSGTTIGRNSVLSAWDVYNNVLFNPEIIIGQNVNIGAETHISAINKIVIGNNVLTGKKLTIIDNSHGNSDLNTLMIPPLLRPLYSKGTIIIEDGVWIGDKVTILGNVRIGANTIIGANSVVTKSFPPNSIIGGVPARLIK